MNVMYALPQVALRAKAMTAAVRLDVRGANFKFGAEELTFLELRTLFVGHVSLFATCRLPKLEDFCSFTAFLPCCGDVCAEKAPVSGDLLTPLYGKHWT